MPIIRAELKLYRSAVVSDAAGNGGRMSANEVISAAVSNLFPPVQQSERTAGSTKYRKAFWKAANDADLTLYSPKIYFDTYTPAQDRMAFFAGTQTDVQSDISSPRLYGVGKLNANVSAAATSIAVLVEAAADDIFQNGDTIRISDMTGGDPDSSGNEEFIAITAHSYASNVCTLTLATALQNGYSASAARVASVYMPSDIKPTFGAVVITAAGDGDIDDDFLLGDSIGAIEQVWTLTFTGPTAYDIVGDTVGAVGSGSVGAGASPNNPSFSKPYFVLQAAAFSGTWASGDTIVFTSHPAAVPIWVKRVVPAAADSYTSNGAWLELDGETAGA